VIDRIAGRLFLSYLFVGAVGLVVASALIAGLIVRYENEGTRQQLIDISTPMLTAVQNGLRQGRSPQEVVRGLADEARAIEARILIVQTQNRRVVADSEGRLDGQVVPPTPTQQDGLLTFRDRDEEWFFVQRAIPSGQLMVARRRAAFGDTLRQLVPATAIGAGAAALLALMLAALLARTITRPLRDLVRGSSRFAGGDMKARVPLGGPREVRELGGAFNAMADEIERARGSERAFLADLSHELRTPLTSIQGFSQAIVEGEVQGEGVGWAARTIQREARRLIRMVEGLLMVARIESGAGQAVREQVALDRVIADAIGSLEAQAREAGIEIRSDVGPLPPVVGDPDRLSQLFINVIDNAVKHSPKGSAVVVGGAAQDGQVVVRVRDRGAGIPAGAEARVFERFYRAGDVEREGSGLGLAIAQAIAQSHGGHIEARNLDGGAEFRVVLPVPSG
jgi:signal transduction histidine kinase